MTKMTSLQSKMWTFLFFSSDAIMNFCRIHSPSIPVLLPPVVHDALAIYIEICMCIYERSRGIRPCKEECVSAHECISTKKKKTQKSRWALCIFSLLLLWSVRPRCLCLSVKALSADEKNNKLGYECAQNGVMVDRTLTRFSFISDIKLSKHADTQCTTYWLDTVQLSHKPVTCNQWWISAW